MTMSRVYLYVLYNITTQILIQAYMHCRYITSESDVENESDTQL